jgi:ribonuclease D
MNQSVQVYDGDLDAAAQSTLADEARSVGLGVDIETSGLSPRDRAIQVLSLSTPTHIAVLAIRPLERPTRAIELLESGGITKTLHHATFDLGFLKYHWGLIVKPVFCTKVAARVAGVDRNPRLENLVGSLLGHRLDKGEQRSNWGARPLSESQIRYAANDVRYLAPLQDVLRKRLIESSRLELFNECMEFLDARVDLALLGLDDVFAYELQPEMVPA